MRPWKAGGGGPLPDWYHCTWRWTLRQPSTLSASPRGCRCAAAHRTQHLVPAAAGRTLLLYLEPSAHAIAAIATRLEDDCLDLRLNDVSQILSTENLRRRWRRDEDGDDDDDDVTMTTTFVRFFSNFRSRRRDRFGSKICENPSYPRDFSAVRDFTADR